MWASSWMNWRTRVSPDSEPGALVAVEPAVLVQAQRQVAVRAQPAAVDERRLRAVHRLEAEELVLGLDDEHVLGVVVPVAGLPPQAVGHEDRRADLLVAAPLLELAHRPLERAPDQLALGMPERGSRRDVVEAEQVERDAQLAVVALLRLGAPPQELVQFLLRRPGRAVDALEHRPLLVAAPVRTGDREQLERPHVAGAGDVRPAAQVDERALLVEGRRRHGRPVPLGVGDEVVDDLDLERLVALHEEGARLGRRLLAQHEGVVGGDARAHPRLDGLEVVGRERPGRLEVVVEPVGDDRPDPELGAGEQVEHRLREDVRRGMAHRTELAGRPVLEQLLGRAALGRLEADLVLVRRSLLAHRCHSLENHETPRPTTGREVHSRGPTRLREPTARALVVALTGDARAGSPAAHGWCRSGSIVELAADARLSVDRWTVGASRSTLIFEVPHATRSARVARVV